MAPLPPPPQATVAAIYESYEARDRGGFRSHLGASIIGNECERALFYSFRWATRAQHAGRLLRLFQTGHLEEDRLIKDLRSAGVTVMDVDPNSGLQWSFSALNGHFGGSADGIVIGLLESPATPTLLECKTHNAKSFASLQKHGVEKSKPLHYCQMITYLEMLGLERGFYLATNKNDDSLYSERVYPNPVLAARLLAKAERVIRAAQPPEKISQDPDYFLCRFCDHRALCHEGAPAERNCRTCLHSSPIPNGRWHCSRLDGELSDRQQRRGCLGCGHRYIPGLVAGEQVDVHGDDVVYRMADGSEWADNGA